MQFDYWIIHFLNGLLNQQTESFFHLFIRLATGTLDMLWLAFHKKKKKKNALLGQYVCFYTFNSFENVKSHCEVHTVIQRRYLHRQIFNILFCPQNLSTVLKSLWRNWCICEYTFAFKRKSTQKLTDLVHGSYRKIFIISVTKKRDWRRWQERNLTPLFSIKFYWCAQQNSLTALDSLRNYSLCMSNFIFLASVQTVMTNITCLLSKFVMFLNYTSFSRTLILLYKILRVFSPDKVWQFCRESTTFFWPYSSGLFFCRFLSLYRSNSFQFWIKLLF